MPLKATRNKTTKKVGRWYNVVESEELRPKNTSLRNVT